MADKTNQQQKMKGQPEVDASGVHPKSRRGQAKQQGQVKHTTNHVKRGRNWLRIFVSGVLVTSAVGAEAMIYTAGLEESLMINTMWLVGVTYAAALVVVNFCKLE